MKWKALVVLGMMNGVYGSEESTPSPVKHFGAKEEKPGEAFSAALRNLDKFGYVPIDIPEDPEPMSSAGSVEKLFAKDPQGRLTPLVNGERTRAFSLGAVGAGYHWLHAEEQKAKILRRFFKKYFYNTISFFHNMDIFS